MIPMFALSSLIKCFCTYYMHIAIATSTIVLNMPNNLAVFLLSWQITQLLPASDLKYLDPFFHPFVRFPREIVNHRGGRELWRRCDVRPHATHGGQVICLKINCWDFVTVLNCLYKQGISQFQVTIKQTWTLRSRSVDFVVWAIVLTSAWSHGIFCKPLRFRTGSHSAVRRVPSFHNLQS
jgi:hypothetical protein